MSSNIPPPGGMPPPWESVMGLGARAVSSPPLEGVVGVVEARGARGWGSLEAEEARGGGRRAGGGGS